MLMQEMARVPEQVQRVEHDVAGAVRALVGRIARVEGEGGDLNLEEALKIEARFIGLRWIAEETPGRLDPHLDTLRDARARFERLKAPLAIRIVDELFRVRGVMRNVERRETRLREALVWLSRTTGRKEVQGVEAAARVEPVLRLSVPHSGTPSRRLVEKLVRDAGAWGRVSVLYAPRLEKELRSGSFREDTKRHIESLCPRRTTATVRVTSRNRTTPGRRA